MKEGILGFRIGVFDSQLKGPSFPHNPPVGITKQDDPYLLLKCSIGESWDFEREEAEESKSLKMFPTAEVLHFSCDLQQEGFHKLIKEEIPWWASLKYKWPHTEAAAVHLEQMFSHCISLTNMATAFLSQSC